MARRDDDKGQVDLVQDLHNLFIEARDYAFHDKLHKKYPSPKVELLKKLNEVIENLKTGKYDNKG